MEGKKKIISYSELKPGDHICVRGEGRPTSASFSSSSSTSPGSSSTPHSASSNSSSSDTSKVRIPRNATIAHHSLFVKVINEKGHMVKVIHKTSNKGVHESVECYPNNIITVLHYESKYEGLEAIERARHLISPTAKYCVLTDNCEHFVYEVRTEKKKSLQARTAVAVIATAGSVSIGGIVGGLFAGALIGGGIGSAVVPVFGTIIGAIAGGIIGSIPGAAAGAITGAVGPKVGLEIENKEIRKEK